jgi:hypothetical protein
MEKTGQELELTLTQGIAGSVLKMDIILKYFSDFTAKQLHQFEALKDLYKEWNEKINVISRKDIIRLLNTINPNINFCWVCISSPNSFFILCWLLRLFFSTGDLPWEYLDCDLSPRELSGLSR